MSHCRSAQDNKALWQKQCHNIDSKTLVSERVDTMDLELLRRTEYNQQYIAAMRPVFNRRALFTDTSAEYVIPEEPACFSEVTIRFRTARNNVDRVFLVCGGQKHLMVRVESKNDFDYSQNSQILQKCICVFVYFSQNQFVQYYQSNETPAKTFSYTKRPSNSSLVIFSFSNSSCAQLCSTSSCCKIISLALV